MITVEQAMDEAVESLGLITSAGGERLLPLLSTIPQQPIRQLIAAHRQTGRLMQADEKRAAGIRANIKISHLALGELSERGRLQPTEAHMVTFLRAFNSLARAKHIQEWSALRSSGNLPADFRIRGTFKDRCGYCRRNDGRVVAGSEAPIFPPEECEVDDCPLGASGEADYIAEAQRK